MNRFEARKRAFLIGTHEPAVADYVGCKDCCKLPLDTLLAHTPLLRKQLTYELPWTPVLWNGLCGLLFASFGTNHRASLREATRVCGDPRVLSWLTPVPKSAYSSIQKERDLAGQGQRARQNIGHRHGKPPQPALFRGHS